MTFSALVSGYRKASTNRDDTLQDVALRELGNAAQWYALANLNDLIPPYITDDLSLVGPRVLFAGSPIKIPTSAPPRTGTTDDADIFGTDVALVNGRLSSDGSNGIAVVRGIANLKQALTNCLVTHPGELRYHPAYGCLVYRLLGKGGTQTINQLGASFVARALRADPRVFSASATASISGDQIDISAVAVTEDGRRVPVSNAIPYAPLQLGLAPLDAETGDILLTENGAALEA